MLPAVTSNYSKIPFPGNYITRASENLQTASVGQIPKTSLANLAPSTRALIFENATSLAESGPAPPYPAFISSQNGLNPQSSVAPNLSLGMNLAASTSWRQTSCGVSRSEMSGFVTPMKIICEELECWAMSL